MKGVIGSIIFYILCIACAQRVPPTGGKKDIIHPKLTLSIPKNQALNFNDKTVELYFDEYVKTENINQNLLITPTIDGIYTTKIKPKGAKLVFDKPFKANTTYSFNFRNTFKDITEGNDAKNIRLVFSTGPVIDSLKISGKVMDPLINKPVFDALVGVYQFSDTLNIKKEKPYYFTKTDSSGNYNIENIKKGTYKVFAIIDNNNNTVFNELTEKIGFKSDTFNLSKNIENVNFEVVKQEKNPLKVLRTRTSANYATVELNKGIKTIKLVFKTDTLPYVHVVDREIKIFNTKNITDSVKIEGFAIDSVDKEYTINQKFIFKKPVKKTDTVKEELRVEIEPKDRISVEGKTPYKFTFSKPIGKFEISNIKILDDTLKNIPLVDSNFKWNDSHNILTISAKSASKNLIRLSIPKGAIITIENDTLRKVLQDNPILNDDDTGIISGDISNAKGTEIVQLLNEKYEIVKEVKYLKKFKFRYVLPGKYYLRLLQDANKNGTWDAGDVTKNIFPEKLQFINGLVILKANFELTGYNFQIQ